jgi:hypothetical protein
VKTIATKSAVVVLRERIELPQAEARSYCLFHQEREESRRGLCESCYQIAALMVRQGLTTWSILQSKGRAVPPRRRSIKEWLLS